MKAIWIEAAERRLSVVDYQDTDDIRRFIGGYLELAYMWPSKEVLYVDEEALLKPQSHFFRFLPRHDPQPLAGNGLVVGRERYDDEGDYIGTDDAVITIDELRPLIRFMNRAEFDAWGKANASEPSITISRFELGPNGERVITEQTIIERWGKTAAKSRPD